MTRAEAIKVLKAIDRNVKCGDCLYYAQSEDCQADDPYDDCIIRKAIWSAISAFETHEQITKERDLAIEQLTMCFDIIDKHVLMTASKRDEG